MFIRAEGESDRSAVYGVNVAAFETRLEADLVDALREQAEPLISLVAEESGGIIGHILVSPVSISNHPEAKLMAIGPMAVRPEHQRTGIGSALVETALQRCREMSYDAVFVLGHPAFYPRFGFVRASQLGIGCEYDVPDDVFMAMELRKGCLQGIRGKIKYHPAFGEA